MRVIVVTSGKGGVGKTTTSAAFASGLALRGFKTAVIDFDVGLRNLDLIMGCERRVVYAQSMEGIKELISECDKSQVSGISFGGQMHGLVVLDENDNVIRPAILWNDGRTQKQTDY